MVDELLNCYILSYLQSGKELKGEASARPFRCCEYSRSKKSPHPRLMREASQQIIQVNVIDRKNGPTFHIAVPPLDPEKASQVDGGQPNVGRLGRGKVLLCPHPLPPLHSFQALICPQPVAKTCSSDMCGDILPEGPT